MREAEAYNNSIYLMAFMPYALLGGLAFAGYRATKTAQKKADAEKLCSDAQAG